jgi:hypothetical protein
VAQPYVPAASPAGYADRPQPASLADVLELVLDKGVVIAGDIKINLLEIELLTIKVRLLIASVDKAREMGITWWESDPSLSGPRLADHGNGNGGGTDEELSQRVAALEQRLREVTGESAK